MDRKEMRKTMSRLSFKIERIVFDVAGKNEELQLFGMQCLVGCLRDWISEIDAIRKERTKSFK